MNVLVGTKQFKMILDEDFVDRLKTLANRMGRDSAQHLAEEVLTIYLPVWTAVADATNRAIAYQSSNPLPDKGIRTAEVHLAPVVATITPAHDPKDEIRQTITTDEIAEAKQRTTPRKTQRVAVLKEKAK